jgi:hypothetical protein
LSYTRPSPDRIGKIQHLRLQQNRAANSGAGLGTKLPIGVDESTATKSQTDQAKFPMIRKQ